MLYFRYTKTFRLSKIFFQFILGGTDYEKGYEMGHESFAQIR